MKPLQLVLCVVALATSLLLPVAARADDGPTATPKTDPFATAVASMTPAPVGTVAPTVTSTSPVTATSTSSVTATVTTTATPSPLDIYEVDDVPASAKRIVIQEVQTRTFWRPSGNDVDWAVVYLKVGRWQIAARTTTDIYDPRITVEGQTADDTANSKDAVLTLTITEERDYLIFVENVGIDGWGQYTLQVNRLSDVFTPTPYPTYTPYPTLTVYPTATSTPYPTYTPYPTLTAHPSASATVYPTHTPYPTYAPPANGTVVATVFTPYPTYTPYPVYPTAVPPSSGNTGSSGYVNNGSGSTTNTATGGAADDGKVAELTPTPAITGGSVSLQVYVDSNRNGVMDFGEEAENVLVFATTRDRSFEAEGYTTTGEALLPLSALSEDEELLLLVPYLHRAANFRQQGGTVTSDVALDLPIYPVYLP